MAVVRLILRLEGRRHPLLRSGPGVGVDAASFHLQPVQQIDIAWGLGKGERSKADGRDGSVGGRTFDFCCLLTTVQKVKPLARP